MKSSLSNVVDNRVEKIYEIKLKNGHGSNNHDENVIKYKDCENYLE